MSWCLVSNTGAVHVLARSMSFVGRENCEINILSRSVDKRHSVINFDRIDNGYSIKDMETVNGTFVNETRIPDQTYVSLQRGDSIRFGYVTYRFDEVDPSSIRQFKTEDSISALSYHTRSHQQKDAHTPTSYEQRTTPVENTMMSYGRTTPLKQDYGGTSQPSSLYGQPAWWGQEDDEDAKGERLSVDKEDGGHRTRRGTYTSTDKDVDAASSLAKLERPTKLPIHEAERERDIPIHMYTRPATDLNPTTPVKRAPTPEHTEVTLMSASEKHVGFTIEFNAKEDAPKMTLNESLSDFVPATVKSKMEGSSKMVEGMKAERLKKTTGDDPDSYQNPRLSPSAVQKLNIMWASSSGKKTSKTSQGDSKAASSSEAGKVDGNKPLKIRVSPSSRQQPVPSKSGPQKSHSSLGHHRSEDQNGDNVSESGTYTIESETQSKEVLEARSRIDEVFGVGMSMDAKQGSDEDTDKDIGDEEIPEEAVTMETVNTEEMDVNKYLDKEYGKPSGLESSRTAEKPKPLQPKPPATGSSTGPAWVRQWAVLASKDTSPQDRSPRSDSSLSPRNQSQGGAVDEASRSPRQAGQPPTAPPRRSGKRILPTTPPERGDKQSHHPASPEDAPKQNGLHVGHSPSSAFYSPRNRDGVVNSQREELHAKETNLTPHGTGSEPNPTVFVSKATAAMGSALQMEEDDFHTEVSMDTEILLKDTETFVKSLEMRMRDRQRSTPSPDLSESYDISHRSFDGDIDTDLDTASCVSLVGTSGTAHPLKPKQASLPPSGYQGNRSLSERTPEAKSNARKTPDPKAKKGSIWNRLSQPAKYKRNEKGKDSTSDCMSDSMDSSSFRRNTTTTGSLPAGRVTGRRTPKEPESKETSPKIIRKIKANLSKPRQTRSTMLRKSRFDGKESPSLDQSDISPSSSMSDMSSSRNSAMFRRLSSQREPGSRSQDPKDQQHSRAKTVSARIDTGRQRLSSRSSEQTQRSEVSLGGQIVQQARSQSLRERKMNAGESSARIMSKVQTSSTRTTTSTSSRKVSQSSADSTSVKKAPTGSWRRYKEPSENDDVDAYIKSVTSRQSSVSSADESSIKSAPAYNYYKPRSNSSPSPHQQRTATSMQHLASGASHQHLARQQEAAMRNGSDDIAQASNSLAESLQRLAKGESTLGMAMEHIPKDERMMDEILGEDTCTVGASPREASSSEQADNHKQPLQRSTSVGYNNSEGVFPQSPVLAQPGSPPISLKHKQWSKPESFDMLVMSSINHLSIKLRDTTVKITYKLKKLQSPDATDTDLGEVLKDSEMPLLKTHNKEIASILKNMRQLEKRLAEIHTMIDPRDAIDVPEQLTPAAQIRRKYISDYGASTSSSSAGTSVRSQKAQQWGQSGRGNSFASSTGTSVPGETPRSSRSDESEYYV